MPRITPFLWFDTEAEEAAEFYCSIFPNSKITGVSRYGDAGSRPAGSVMTVSFVLNGHELIALNGGPEFTFTEAISLFISCDDPARVERAMQAMFTMKKLDLAALQAASDPSAAQW